MSENLTLDKILGFGIGLLGLMFIASSLLEYLCYPDVSDLLLGEFADINLIPALVVSIVCGIAITVLGSSKFCVALAEDREYKKRIADGNEYDSEMLNHSESRIKLCKVWVVNSITCMSVAVGILIVASIIGGVEYHYLLTYVFLMLTFSAMSICEFVTRRMSVRNWNDLVKLKTEHPESYQKLLEEIQNA